ncbi:MAG: endo-1,4-beta-xylanase [Planctomycetia bacterium]|nr:endo-1,4-beta-xylanase [Planctomycetia bacterium]
MKRRIFLMLTLFCLPLFPNLSAKESADVMSPAYRAIWNDEVQKEIDARIEKYRKADAAVALSDVKPGTEIKIDQISHKFLFGAHIFNFNQLGTPERNQKYKDLYGTFFNSATIAFYWKKFEPEPGKPRFKTAKEDTEEYWNSVSDPKAETHWRRPSSDQCVEFCESKGIQMNGHTIIWGNRTWQHPGWLPTDPAKTDEMQRLFDKRMIELAERYKDRLNRWDIVNESAEDFNIGKASRYGIMPEDYAYKALKLADKVFPKSVELNINDYCTSKKYTDQVADLLKRGCRITNVGVQMHLFNPKQTRDVAAGKPIQTPDFQKERLSALDVLGRPLHLSEITITAPGDDAKGRAIQAEVARNLYRYWFSWPSMMGITWWNVVDDCGAPGEPLTSGLFTRNMEPKPSFTALNKLINHDWKTHLVKKADSEAPVLKFRGFKGNYKITWTDKSGNAQSKIITVD